MRKPELHILAVKVRRDHVKLFLAYSGAALMGVDFFVFQLGLHHFEMLATSGGKLGAFAAGAAVFFEKVVRV